MFHRAARVLLAGSFLLAEPLTGCGGTDVDVTVEQPTPSAGSTVVPFPFSGVDAAYVGVSGSYPYLLLYEEPFSCEQLEASSDGELGAYTNILILVGGWDEGTYPVFDVLGATGPYSLDGQAISYMADRDGHVIQALEYARGGVLEVERISELSQTVTGRFSLEFDSGTLVGDFTIREYCDVY